MNLRRVVYPMKSTNNTQDAVKLKLSTEFNSTSRRNWSSYPRNTHQISHRFICHYLHITVQSPNIWRSVFLYIIIVNTIYVLTTRGVDTTTTPSRIHVFFNSYKGKSILSTHMIVSTVIKENCLNTVFLYRN